jgi:Uma2 family endonuclease
MPVEISRKLFSIDDCYRMADVGILSPQDRVELIRGEIINMTPIGSRHGAVVDRTAQTITRQMGDAVIVRAQGTVVLDRFSAPQPDIAVLRKKDDFYAGKNPGPADILLIVEVAESSLEYDRTVKAALYAIAGIPEYWIADLQSGRLICHLNPAQDVYRVAREFHPGDQVTPQLLPELVIPIEVLTGF